MARTAKVAVVDTMPSVYAAFEHLHRLARAMREPGLNDEATRSAALKDAAMLERTCMVARAKRRAPRLSEGSAVCVAVVSTCDGALLRSLGRREPASRTTEEFLTSVRRVLNARRGPADTEREARRLAEEADAICAALLNAEIGAAEVILDNPDILIADYINR